MSQLDQLISLVSNLSNRLNQIESGSKRIFELPEASNPSGTSKFPISTPSILGETTEYITLNAILQWCIQEMQNLQDSTRLIQMMPPELLSGPRRVRIPVEDEEENPFPIKWKVEGVNFEIDEEVIHEIPDAEEDKYRKDLILADGNGQTLRLAGTESTEGIIEPVVPEGHVLLTTVTVFGDSTYEDPSIPIVGSNFIKKESEKWTNVIVTGPTEADFLMYPDEFVRNINITGSPNNAVFAGFHNTGGSGQGANVYWDGAEFTIMNSKSVPQKLRHNSGTATLKLYFIAEEDYILAPNHTVKFKRFGNYLIQVSGDFVFQDDILVSLASGKTLGRYANGQIIPAKGKSFEQVMRLIAIEPQYPELIAPTFSLSHNQGTREVGTTVNLTLTASFNRGQILGKLVGGVWEPLTEQGKRAGAVTSYVIDGTNTGTTPSKNNPSYVVVLGNNSFIATVSYAAGPQPKDSENENFDLPLPAGSLNASTQFTGIIPYFYGVLNPGQTIDDINLASFTKVVASSSGTITIPWSGVVGKRLVVVYPATSTTKTKWWVTALNNGNIGNSGDLFPSTQNKNFNSPNSYWTGVSFKVIISDVTNADYNMEFRNS